LPSDGSPGSPSAAAEAGTVFTRSQLAPNVEQMHFFDPDSEAALGA
jgi:hypothetical protein